MCSDGLKEPLSNFLFSSRAIFSLCFCSRNWNKNTIFSYLLPLINFDIVLQKSRVTLYFNILKRNSFWRKFLNKLPTVLIESNAASNVAIQLLQHLRILQENLNSFIGVSKQHYYSRMSAKLTKFHKSSKGYCSLLKTFLNNKKILLIPPLYHQVV